MDFEAAPLQVKQPARAAKIVEQMAVDMKKIGILADASDHMLVPDLRQHGAAGLLQDRPPFGFSRPAASPPLAVSRLVLEVQNGLYQSMTN
jgi:hypothetical protein